jgi:hypothetical protein
MVAAYRRPLQVWWAATWPKDALDTQISLLFQIITPHPPALPWHAMNQALYLLEIEPPDRCS